MRARRVPHRAWAVAAVTLLALVAAAAFRSTTGALFEPLESEFGWSRTQLSAAVTLNLVVYGLVAPFAAVLMERFPVRGVAIGALAMVAAGAGLAVLMTSLWQLYLLWGLLVGVGTGAMALVLGAVVANRWFATNRGLVMGIFSAANACGQLVFLPAVVVVAERHGWRPAALTVAAFALLNARDLLNALQFRDAPSRMRLEFIDAEGQLAGGGEVQQALVNQGLWEFEYPPFLQELRRPVFVIAGVHDRTSYPEQVEWLADLAGADVTVLDAGHYPWLDDEDAFAEALEEALTR